MGMKEMEREHPETKGEGIYRARFCRAHWLELSALGGQDRRMRVLKPNQQCDVAGCKKRAAVVERTHMVSPPAAAHNPAEKDDA